MNNHLDPYGFMIPEIFYSGTTPEGDAVIAAMPTIPNAERQILIQTLVAGLIDDGIWSKLDFLYLLAAHAQDSSLLNWINPGTHDATVINLLAANYIIDRGWTGNGVNGYLNTNYTPSTDAINYALNSASIGVYVRTDVNEDKFDIGVQPIAGNNYISITSRYSNIAYIKNNNGITTNIANTDSRGFFINTRLDATDQDLYKNKVKIIDGNDVSVAIPNDVIIILALNINGVPSLECTKQISTAFTGAGMTQTDVNNFTDRLELFLDAIGAGIIP